jgi:hypothetical protein
MLRGKRGTVKEGRGRKGTIEKYFIGRRIVS